MGIEVEFVDLSRAIRRLDELQTQARSQAVDIVHEDLAIGACSEDGGLGAMMSSDLDILDGQLFRGQARSAALVRKLRCDGRTHINPLLDVQAVDVDGLEHMSPSQNSDAAVGGSVDAGDGNGRGVDGILRGIWTVRLGVVRVGGSNACIIGDVGVGPAKKPLYDLALVIHGDGNGDGAVRPVEETVEMASLFGCSFCRACETVGSVVANAGAEDRSVARVHG